LFNGAGTFNRLMSWVNDKNAAIAITASRMDTDSNDFVTGFNLCLTRDGQGVASANLPMAGFRHTGVANGVNRTDYAALGQVEDGVLNWAVAGGTADAITATYVPAITTLVDGQECWFRATAANATTTPTFSPNTLPARTITKRGGVALVIGDIAGNLAEIGLRYNLANTRWELLNPKKVAVADIVVTQPTRTVLTSGAGTYTRPAGCTRIFGCMIGGGGGGAGSGTAPGATGAGGDTTFGTLTAGGGSGAASNAGGGGGAATNGDVNITGGSGAQCGSLATSPGGMGASSPFGGGGACGASSTGSAAMSNTGAGGGGAASAGTVYPGGGGGAGGYLERLIIGPSATYSYAVGAGGSGGAGGTSGAPGGNGGSGLIIIDEFYN
jgi:hypothetical protein